MSVQFAESVVLSIAATWCFHLYTRRAAGRVPLFMGLFLALPSIGLFAQGMQWTTVQSPLEWAVVVTNAGITTAFIRSTWHLESEIVYAFVSAEMEIRRREEKVRAHTLASIALRSLEDNEAPPQGRRLASFG